MLTRILAIVVKDLRLLWSDRRSRLTLIVPSLVQLIVFGYAATFDVDQVPIAIVDEDAGVDGRALASRFAGSPAFRVVALPVSERDIASLIDNAEVMLALHIGPRFSAELAAGTLPDVQIIMDGRQLPTALAINAYVTAILGKFNQDYAAANGFPRPAAVTVMRPWFNPNLISHWFIVPGLIAKLTLILILTLSVSVARERELGSFEQMVALGLTPTEILCAKAFLPIAVGLVQSLAMSAIGAYWFEVPFRGSTALLVLSQLVFVTAGTGIGVLLSARARTQRQATLRIFMFLVPAIILSGFATPISAMPDWLQTVTLVNPLRYDNVILRGLFLRGIGWSFVWPRLWPLALIGMTTLALAHHLLRPARL